MLVPRLLARTLTPEDSFVPLPEPPTLTAHAELQRLARALDSRTALSAAQRFDLRTRALHIAELIDAAEDAPAAKFTGEQALAIVRAFAADAAPDLLRLVLDRMAAA